MILDKVTETLRAHDMISKGDSIIVAVSGGADSVCLLHVLYELKDFLGIKLIVARFDHGLRPGEDETETEFVKSLALSLDLPFETGKTCKDIISESGSLEENARRERYLFLENISKKLSADKIAMGHNLDDQAETVLIRLLRGSGTHGLSGIPPRRNGGIIRPLINVSREEIENYLKYKKVIYITDSSNLKPIYTRNRIRLELIPMLLTFQPQLVEILGKTSEILRNDNNWMEEEAEKWFHKADRNVNSKGELILPLKSLTGLPEAFRKRIIRRSLYISGSSNLRRIGSRHIESIHSLIQGDKPQGRLNMPDNIIVKRVYDKLVFKRCNEKTTKDFNYQLNGPGKFNLENPGCHLSIEMLDTKSIKDTEDGSRWSAFLDGNMITFPLTVRNFQPGDKFIPLGMKGHKKVKNFFIDLKVPVETRIRTPLVICGEIPVWISGFRIDDRFRVTPASKKILKFSLEGFS